MWDQFRRLLLGTVVEAMLAEDLQVAFASIQIEFDRNSAFHVPRLDNYMRFSGELRADLLAAPAPAVEARLETRLRAAWPELLAVIDIPIGDRLTADRNVIDVVFERGTPERLRVRFDLAAD